MSFPITNSLKVEDQTDMFVLSDSPKCFLHLGKDNIVYDVNAEPSFVKVLQSGTYAIYKHLKTDNYIAIEKQLMAAENFNLQLKGKLLCYDEKGIYVGKKDSRILQ